MDHVLFILAGFAVVLGTLAMLWGVMALIGLAFTSRPSAAAAASAPASAAPADPSAGVPPHHLAAIGAAVAAMTGGRGRVLRVAAPAHAASAWAQEGRMAHFASHRLPRSWDALRHRNNSEKKD